MCLCGRVLTYHGFLSSALQRTKEGKKKSMEKLNCCFVTVVICVVNMFRASKHLTKDIEESDGWEVKDWKYLENCCAGRICLIVSLEN